MRILISFFIISLSLFDEFMQVTERLLSQWYNAIGIVVQVSSPFHRQALGWQADRSFYGTLNDCSCLRPQFVNVFCISSKVAFLKIMQYQASVVTSDPNFKDSYSNLISFDYR